VVAIFPVIGHPSFAKDEPDQIGEARLRANIVRQDDDATLTGLDTYHGVRRLAVVATLFKPATLRAVEHGYSQAGVQILPLLAHRQVREEKGPQMGCSDMQIGLRHLGA
jgi:hypothetical protein